VGSPGAGGAVPFPVALLTEEPNDDDRTQGERLTRQRQPSRSPVGGGTLNSSAPLGGLLPLPVQVVIEEPDEKFQPLLLGHIRPFLRWTIGNAVDSIESAQPRVVGIGPEVF
jgi:hypothetical protein